MFFPPGYTSPQSYRTRVEIARDLAASGGPTLSAGKPLIGTPEQVGERLIENMAACDAGAFMAGIAEPEVKAQLKANTDELIARGGFGSPTIYVNGDDMYFGNDRLPLVREALLRRRS